MLTMRWGLALAVALLGAGAVLYFRRDPERESHAEAPLELVGQLELAGLDPARLRVRCTKVRLETGSVEHWAEVEPGGGFRIPGLLDTDYRVEVVARHDPSLVLGQVDFVRPGGDLLLVAADPTRLWAETAGTGVTPNTD